MTKVNLQNPDRDDAGLADFRAGNAALLGDSEPVTVAFGVIRLTSWGEKPVPSRRLAEVLGRSVSEAGALARQWAP